MANSDGNGKPEVYMLEDFFNRSLGAVDPMEMQLKWNCHKIFANTEPRPMSMVNDYLMFRLLMEKDESRRNQRRQSIQPYLQQHRSSMFVPRTSISDEPFCSPIVPHIPIRQRLSSRRGTSVDVGDEAPMGFPYASSIYGGQRRRRMSLLQTLRQQNRQLNDSGLDIHRLRTDSESTNRDTSSPPNRSSPPPSSPTKKTFASLKSKLFGKREKRSTPAERSSFNQFDEHSQSCDVIGVRSRKSPSTTNDSGRGSQAHLDQDRIIGETVAIIERPNDENDEPVRPYRRIRTSSCPDLSSLHISLSSGAPLVDSESEDDPVERNSSPITAADCLIERRLLRRAMEVATSGRGDPHHQRSQRAQLAM